MSRSLWPPLLRSYFGPLPVVGKVYEMDDGPRDPFGIRQPLFVRVMGLRNGWVRFKTVWPRGDSFEFPDSALDIATFRFCYCEPRFDPPPDVYRPLPGDTLTDSIPERDGVTT